MSVSRTVEEPIGDHRLAWRLRGLELASIYHTNQWALGEWWIAGKPWSRERALLVNSPAWRGPSAARLRTIAYVVRRQRNSSFRQDVSFGHHEAVASLDRPLAEQFLHRALDKNWSVEHLKAAVPAHRQSNPTIPPAISQNVVPLIKRRHTAILADPPWQFDHPIVRGRIHRHYSTLPISDIMALPIADYATRDSYLFLWAPNPLLREAMRVMEDAWGFTYQTNCVWLKDHLGGGNYWRNGHELLLLGTRGKAGGFLDKTLLSYFTAPLGRHSEKPGAVYDMIERAVPGPYLELFARRRHDGWNVALSPEAKENK